MSSEFSLKSPAAAARIQ